MTSLGEEYAMGAVVVIDLLLAYGAIKEDSIEGVKSFQAFLASNIKEEKNED